jgi:hypothetical protein
MNMPGFTAETSICKNEHYCAIATLAQSEEYIYPAQIPGRPPIPIMHMFLDTQESL